MHVPSPSFVQRLQRAVGARDGLAVEDEEFGSAPELSGGEEGTDGTGGVLTGKGVFGTAGCEAMGLS
jgi:hypothetical protein